MKVQEYKDKVYEEYKAQIDLIIDTSAELRKARFSDEIESHKDTIGVATDKFIQFVQNAEESLFVNIPEAKARIAELKAQVTE